MHRIESGFNPSAFWVPLITTAALVLLTASPATCEAWDWKLFWVGKSVTASGNVKTETREATGFSGIELSLPATVTIKQGSKEGLTIEADDNFLPLIETVVERGRLRIRPTEKMTIFKGRSMKLNITIDAINIESLSVSGSGDIVADELNSPKLRTSIAGSGEVNIKSLTSDSVKVSIAGSGDLNLGGTAKELEGSIAGSGSIKADRLKAQNVVLKIAGAGEATIWATDTMKLSIAGSGDVKYWGDAKVTQSVAGSGRFTRLGKLPI
ncbi:MAG: head GIN domain-containing protein [Burkholderiales bacterium]